MDISQRSVATYLRCDGLFKYHFVPDLTQCLPVKEFWKSVDIWGNYGQEFSVLFFDSRCSLREMNICNTVVLLVQITEKCSSKDFTIFAVL